MDVDGQAHLCPVGGDGHLGGVDAEIHKTPREVVRPKRFKIRIEFAARVTVGFGVPTEPVAGAQIHFGTQSGFGNLPGADDANFLDASHVALDHIEAEIDPIALDRGHGGDDLRSKQTAVDVLPFQFLLGLVGHGLVKRPSFGQSNVAQGFAQGVFVKLFGADQIQGFDQGALFNHQNHDIALGFDANVVEQTQTEQRTDGIGAPLIAVNIPDPKRQRGKNRTGFDALQALDADVAHRERISRPSQLNGHESHHQATAQSEDQFRHHRFHFFGAAN